MSDVCVCWMASLSHILHHVIASKLRTTSGQFRATSDNKLVIIYELYGEL